MQGFTPPKVGIGDAAVYRRTAASDPVAFIVSRVDQRTVSGNLLGSSMMVHGLHHVDDPEVHRPGLLEPMETWELSASHKQMQDIQRRLDVLEFKTGIAPLPGHDHGASQLATASTSLHQHPIAAEDAEDPEVAAKRMIHDGVDKVRIREATGLHHKVVDKLIRDHEATRAAARENEIAAV